MKIKTRRWREVKSQLSRMKLGIVEKVLRHTDDKDQHPFKYLLSIKYFVFLLNSFK
jgi:hypothetical protein